MFCHIVLHSPRSTTAHSVGQSRHSCHGIFFDCLKICPCDHGNHSELQLSSPFPYVVLLSPRSEIFPAILGKGPWPKLGKMMDLTAKLGEINDIEHKGSKIYPQNQILLDCIIPTIPLKFKYHSDMSHCF